MAAARAAEVAEGYSTSCMRVASSEVGVLRWSHGQDDSLAARAWHGRGSLDSMAAAVSGMAWLQPASAAAAWAADAAVTRPVYLTREAWTRPVPDTTLTS